MLAYNPNFGLFSFVHQDGFFNNLNVSTLSGFANKCPNVGTLVPNELAPSTFKFPKELPNELLSTPDEPGPPDESGPFTEMSEYSWLGGLGGTSRCKSGDFEFD